MNPAPPVTSTRSPDKSRTPPPLCLLGPSVGGCLLGPSVAGLLRPPVAGDAEVGAADAHDVAAEELPSAAGFFLAVDLDLAVGEQVLDVRADVDHVGQLQELTEPDGLGDDD